MSKQQLKVADIEKVSSKREVCGHDGQKLELVFERRAVAPYNVVHVADTEGNIIYSSDSQLDVSLFLKGKIKGDVR